MSDLPPPSASPDVTPPPPPTPPEVVPATPATPAPEPPSGPAADSIGSHAEASADGGDPSPANPDDNTMGIVMYLLPLVGLLSVTRSMGLPLVAVVAPTILWLVKKDQSPYLDQTGKEVVNFNITAAICVFALQALFLLTAWLYIGYVFLPVMWLVHVAWLVLTGISAYNAIEGKFYRFPVSLRLIK